MERSMKERMFSAVSEIHLCSHLVRRLARRSPPSHEERKDDAGLGAAPPIPGVTARFVKNRTPRRPSSRPFTPLRMEAGVVIPDSRSAGSPYARCTAGGFQDPFSAASFGQ